MPALFFAGLLAGPPAAALVVMIAVPLVWWAFMPPVFEFVWPAPADINSITMFLFISLFLICLADGCRAAVALLSGSTAPEEQRGG